MANIRSSAPAMYIDGIDDQSARAVVETFASSPQHLALLYLLSESGPTKTTEITSMSQASNLFGEKTFSQHGGFWNHQTLLMRELLEEGNAVMVKRVLPEGAAKASLTLCADVLVKTDGTVSVKFVTRQFNEDVFSQTTTMEGERKEDGAVSTLYPLLYLRTSFYGESGNNLGIRLIAPDNHSTVKPDSSIIDTFHTRMVRLQFVRKLNERTTPTVVKTILGEDYVDVSLTPNVYTTLSNVDQEYYIEDVLLENYADADSEYPSYAPFEKVALKRDNLKAVQTLVRDAALKGDATLASELTAPDMTNIWTMTTLDGKAYPNAELVGALTGGLVLGDERNIFATGGLSGNIEKDTFDKLVQKAALTFGDDEDFTSSRVFPFSHVYDTGFSMDTKYALCNIMTKRPDLKVVLTTYMYTDDRGLTYNEELSRGQALRNHMAGNPESILYGTKACRGDIVYLSGRWIDSSVRGIVPLVIDYACNMARMSGAASGVLNTTYQFDVWPNNKVRRIRDLNLKSFSIDKTTALWLAGGIWAQQGDSRTLYYPGIRSIYKEETSTLLSPITVNIMCDVIRRVDKVHMRFSGNATLTDGQLCEQCDEAIAEALKGKYGDRVKFKSHSYLSDRDKSMGTSWSTDITVYANNPRNVFNVHLIAQRMSAYTADA